MISDKMMDELEAVPLGGQIKARIKDSELIRWVKIFDYDGRIALYPLDYFSGWSGSVFFDQETFSDIVIAELTITWPGPALPTIPGTVIVDTTNPGRKPRVLTFYRSPDDELPRWMGLSSTGEIYNIGAQYIHDWHIIYDPSEVE